MLYIKTKTCFVQTNNTFFSLFWKRIFSFYLLQIIIAFVHISLIIYFLPNVSFNVLLGEVVSLLFQKSNLYFHHNILSGIFLYLLKGSSNQASPEKNIDLMCHSNLKTNHLTWCEHKLLVKTRLAMNFFTFHIKFRINALNLAWLVSLYENILWSFNFNWFTTSAPICIAQNF